MYLTRAMELHSQIGSVKRTNLGGGGVALGRRARWFHRRRQSGTQGRPPKAPMITELLYAWFCSLRRSVTSRIPGVVLKRKAEFLVEEH